MTIQYNRQKIQAFDRIIECSCQVRNLENANRSIHQVVYTEDSTGSKGVPYSPQIFPLGIWVVSGPVARTSPYLAPFFIPTDAHQIVDEWMTEQDGDEQVYARQSKRQVMDWGYGLHNSTSMTTLGCIRIATKEDLMFLVTNIGKCLDNKEKVLLEVDTSIRIS